MVAGLLLAAAFPNLGIAGLAWVAPGLMLAAAAGKHGGQAFRIGYVAGLTHYLILLYWLLLIPYRWHGIPFGPAAGWLGLSGFAALFPATWVWILSTVHRPQSTGRSPQSTVHSPQSRVHSPQSRVHSPESRVHSPQSTEHDRKSEMGACRSAFRTPHSAFRTRFGLQPLAFSGTWRARTGLALWGAALWVALEMLRARLFGGFPWDLLGVSQYRLLPLIQLASVTGVYGVSFVVVWCSLSLLWAGVTVIQRPVPRSLWLAEIFLPILVIALAFNAGMRHIRHSPPPARAIRLTLLQPGIPQTVIWDQEQNRKQFQETLRLAEAALTNRPDVLVWPESAIPELLRYDEATALAVFGMARRHHVWMIVDADDFQRRPNAAKPEEGDFYNGSFLIDREGRLKGTYWKRSLVIFGEYIPLVRWLPFLKWFTPIQGGFTSGTRPAQFQLTDLNTTASVLICFEDVFPQLAHGDVRPGTDFLVNLTNDGWFGQSAEQWQHAASAVLRAVETGRPLVRCTNNGITCWIDALGRIRQVFRDSSGSVYGKGLLTLELPLPDPGARPLPTFYDLHGDWFGWSCVTLAALVLGGKLLAARRRPARPPE